MTLNRKNANTGRARAVLVWDDHPPGQAMVTSVVAQSRRRNKEDEVVFGGVVHLDDTCRSHIKSVVVPMTRLISTALASDAPCVEVAVANVSPTATRDLGVYVSGYSLDLPIALAILSCLLGVQFPADVVCTGHISSADGDLALVRGIPAKLRAAVDAPDIRRFVMPNIEQDSASETMTPKEREAILTVMRQYKHSIEIIQVPDIAACLQAILPAENIALASLKTGFYETNADFTAETSSPVERGITFLADGNRERFWQSVEQSLLAKRCESARALLRAWVEYFERRKRYPQGTGKILLQIMQSLPPLLRRSVLGSALVTADLTAPLCRLAAPEDMADVRLLLDATNGIFGRESPVEVSTKSEGSGRVQGKTKALLEQVMSELSPDNLAKRIGIPADTARACYAFSKVTVDSHEEFIDAIAGFVLHLYRHCRGVQAVPDTAVVSAEAFALLERAFEGQGGVPAARAEARDSIKGGLRFIYDVLTESYKREEKMKYSNLILKQALDSTDWPGRVRFMKALIKRLTPYLSAEILQNDPRQYVRAQEEIVHAYISSMENVRSVFRRL